MSDYAEAVRALVPFLEPWMPSHESTRNLGRGDAFPLSADLPGGLQAGDRFFRMALGWACFYDGTRWLTVTEHPYVILPYQTFSLTNSFTDILIRTDYAPYITRVVTQTNVTAPNSAASNWLITISGINTARSAASTIETFNTSLDTAGVETLRDNAPGTSPTPTNRTFLRVIGQKNGATGTPGNMTIAHTIYTRLIVP